MTSNTPIITSEADFFKLKDSLIDFLKSKQDFTDYQFDGSALNILTDVLAYGGHIQAAHANLVFSESFLDSSQQRSSVVSHAKQIGYTPRSSTAPYAIVTMSFSVSGNPSQYVIPKNTKFAATIEGTSYTFVTVEDTIAVNNGSNMFTGTVKLYQGKFTDYNYVVSSNQNQRFLIPSSKVDTRFLAVSVAPTNIGVFTEYSHFNSMDIGSLSPTSNVFFIQESYDGFFEIYFGDGKIGRSVVQNNIIKLTYLITDGPAANFARIFSLSTGLPGVSGVSVTTVEHSQNGAERESIESIKFLAPFYYESQNRAVTETDYKAILKANYSDIDDVAVWGGEKNNPPFFGKVFLAVKPKNSTYFSSFIKQSIQNEIISKYNVLSIRPEIVDPDYVDITVSTVATYNSKLYKPTTSVDLPALITEKIVSFFNSETNKFGASLYFSKLVSAIDSASPLILNSITNITLEKSLEIYPGSSAKYRFEFNNFIHPGSLTSNEFRIGGNLWKLKDTPVQNDTSGIISVYRKVGNTTLVLNSNIGTINYNTGEIIISNFKIDYIENPDDFDRLYISVTPGSFIDVNNPDISFTDFNVYTNKKNQIIRLNARTGGAVVSVLPDNTAGN